VNPTLLVEVLSPSTEGWDRGGKFQGYQQIESLKEYVLVSAEKPLVETYFRQPGGAWIYHAAAGVEGRARLNSIGVDLALAEVYSGVEFPPAAAGRPSA
jgi:Uma2 family endonuclease